MLDISKIYSSVNYGDFKVLNYFNAKSIEIEFIDTGYKTKVQAFQIRNGKVKDKLMLTVFGVGFMGDGDYKAKVKGKQTKAYQTWSDMLRRCYSDKFQLKHPTYIDCFVDPIWHNFQNFAQWFDENYIKGFDIDKDIKFEGNKVYSPENCLFVSRKENSLKAHAKHYRFTSPEGETVNIYNLSEFCREKGLHQGHMCSVANGKLKQCKQWTCSYK